MFKELNSQTLPEDKLLLHFSTNFAIEQLLVIFTRQNKVIITLIIRLHVSFPCCHALFFILMHKDSC